MEPSDPYNPSDIDAATLQRFSDLVSRAQARTSATGVAIALVDGGDLVTQASFGASAPDVGTRTPVEGSFSGRCIQTGEMLVCEDVTRDARVNGPACADAGIYSICVLPIEEGGKCRGILAAFSDRPNSFSTSQITVLKTFAEIANELLHHRDQALTGEPPTPVASVVDPSAKCETVLHDVLSAYEKERAAREAEKQREPKPVAPPKTEFKPDFTAPKPPEPAAPRFTAPEPKPTVVTMPTPVQPAASVKTPEQPTPPLAPQLVRTQPAASRGATAAKMAPAKIDLPDFNPPKRDESKPKSEDPLLSFAADPLPGDGPRPTLPSVAIGTSKPERTNEPDPAFLTGLDQRQSGGSGASRFMIVGAAVIVLMAGAVYGFSRLNHHPAAAVAAPVETHASAPVAAQPTFTPSTEMTVPASAPAKPFTSADIVPSQAKEAKHEEQKAKHETEAQKPSQPDPVFIKPGSGAVKKTTDTPDVQAPMVLAGMTTPTMPQVGGNVSMPKPDFAVATASAPKLLSGARPAFPAAAAAMRLKGDTVVLNAKILTSGRVGDITVVRGHPIFVETVKNAVKQWKYQPAMMNNEPTESSVEIVINFGDVKK